MLTEKYIRPTPKEHGHTDIYWNGEYVGYIIQNRSPFATVGQNWHFVSNSDSIQSFHETNRTKVINSIKNKLN